MTFTNEHELEDHLRALIMDQIVIDHPEIFVLENKIAADIVICRNGERPSLFFIETKLFNQKSNRLGIETGKGKGYQPEIIARNLDYFEMYLR